MKFYDIDYLKKRAGITNKYLLTVIVANWSRYISEQKSRVLEEDLEQYLSVAMDDIAKERVKLRIPASRAKGVLPGGYDVDVEK